MTVTVYTPVYNGAAYIHEAVQSILKQTHTDFEYIIVNDGSTDNTLEIIRSFQDSRIKIVNLEANRGNRYAANVALKGAIGKYIFRMDADDISVPDRLEQQIDFMEQNPDVGICGGHLMVFGNEHSVWKYPVTEAEIKIKQLYGTPVMQPVSVIRTDVIRKHELYYAEEGLSYAEDIDLFYRIIKVSKAGNVDKVLLKYRKHATNITSQLKQRGLELNKVVFSFILRDMGFELTDEQMTDHLRLFCRFIDKLDQEQVKAIVVWKHELVKQNNAKKIVDSRALDSELKRQWERLFYLLQPSGYAAVKMYLKHDHGSKAKKWMSFLKSRLKS